MDWEAIALRSGGQYEAEDFERACYRLVTELVIYRADRAGAGAYWLIVSHQRIVEEALRTFGVDLHINTNLQYVVAKPRHAGATLVSTEETLIALVLRRYYDERMRAGEINEHAEVLCDLEEFAELYRQMTRRELPAKGAFMAVLRSLRRWGIAREPTEEEGFALGGGLIVIRPAIVEVLGEEALARLASLEKGDRPPPGAADTDELDEEGEDAA